jgi:hypothetical protein
MKSFPVISDVLFLSTACSAFYRPRSGPDKYAVTVHCIEPGTIASVEVRHFDGQHWEEAFAAHFQTDSGASSDQAAYKQ